MLKLADGLWLLNGFPRYYFNVYLMQDVLVDAATRWGRWRILRQLRDRPPRLMALTHCHPDHQGSAFAVCERFGVPLACHEGDRAAMEGRAPMQPDNKIMHLGHRVWAGPARRVDRILRDGEELAGFRVIHAPGHTPGEVMFFREKDRILIAGDVLDNLNFRTGRPGLLEPPWFFSQDRLQNRHSIRLLHSLRPALVCFGHGPPLRRLELLDRFMARRIG